MAMVRGVMRTMRSRCARVAAGVAVFALALGASGCSLMTPSLEEAESAATQQTVDDSLLVQPGTLTVALDTTDAPQVMTGNDGELTGYDIEVASAIAQNMGLKVAFVNAASPSKALDSGEADIYLGATASDESGDITVNGEFLQNATAVFGVSNGAQGATTTVTASDLGSARVGVQDGSSSQEALARVGIVASNTYQNVNECFEALASGEVDYVACDATAGGYLSRSYENMFFVGVISSSTSYGIAYRSSASDLAEQVESTFDSLATDGTLDAIHQIWYGSVPLSTSSEVLSGVTVSSGDDSGESGSEGADSASSGDDEPVITDDINSLN